MQKNVYREESRVFSVRASYYLDLDSEQQWIEFLIEIEVKFLNCKLMDWDQKTSEVLGC